MTTSAVGQTVGSALPVALSALLLLACSDEPPPTEVPVPVPVQTAAAPEVTVVTGAPSATDDTLDTPQAAYASSADITALGSLGTLTIVGATDGAYKVATGEGDDGEANSALETIEVFKSTNNTVSESGPVRSVLRRSDNLLVASDQGVFVSYQGMLVPSPVTEQLAALDIRGLHQTEGTTKEQIWITAAEGLYRYEDGQLTKWSIEGTKAEEITAVLAHRQDVFVAFGGTLYSFTLAGDEATVVDYDFGTINALNMGLGDRLQIATNAGLYERESDLAYVQYTLADDGGSTAVESLVVGSGVVFVLTSTAVLKMEEGGKFTIAASLPAEATASVLALADSGMAWLGAGQTVSSYQLGTVVAFEQDVRPIFQANCMSCHGQPPTGMAPAIDFVDYAVATADAVSILDKVVSGNMPPGNPLSAEKVKTIQFWYQGGLQE